MKNSIDVLSGKLKNSNKEINIWLQNRIKGNLLYASFDLRCSGTKIAPIDSNLFPSGFNNLSKEDASQASLHIAKIYNKKNILLVIEEYTRNYNYLKNVVSLKQIIENSGNNVVCATCNNIAIDFDKLHLEKIKRIDDKVVTDSGFIPEIIILNKDMTLGPPEILSGLKQHVVPNINSGWFNRKKSSYFKIYNDLATEFAKDFDFDPWLISAMFEHCTNIDFKHVIGMDDVVLKAEKLLTNLQIKYKEYGISEEPYLFLKPNNGTQGMGISTISKLEEVRKINKNFRKKMHMIKSNVVVTDIVIQEGIKTADFYINHAAEPMVYIIGKNPVAYFYRYNTDKNEYTNLNSAGANFATITNNQQSNYMNLLEVIAKLSLIATEIEYDSFLNK